MTPDQSYDVIVIGAGLAGLTAAALLARAGRSVLLLERGAAIGGVCRAEDSAAGRVELGPALITGFGPDGPLAHLADRLGLSVATRPCEPILQVATPRHRLSFFAEPERLWAEIRREFPAEEAGWRALLFEADLVAREQRNLAAVLPPLPPEGWSAQLSAWRVLGLGKYYGPRKQAVRLVGQAAGAPARRALARHGLGPASQQVIDALLWYLRLRDADECSMLEAAIALHALRDGCVAIAGGMASLLEALRDRFLEAGGTLRLGTEVAACLADRRRVRGVVTAAGDTIRSRWVVCTTSPDVLAGRLLPARRGWLNRPTPVAGSWIAEHAAAAAAVRLPERHVPSELAEHCLVVSSADRAMRSGNCAMVHAVPAPAGAVGDPAERLLTVCRVAPPASLRGGGTVEAGLLDALDQILPGAARLRTASQTFDPGALEALWGLPGAAVRYARPAPAALGRRGFGHRLGWSGLVWAGAWTVPGRLVSEVADGATAVADLLLAGR